MNALILCVGKLKERWQQEGVGEYLKRLSRYGKYEVLAVEDEREPEKPSPALDARVKQIEGERLLHKIRPEDRVIALCIEGKGCSSEALAEKMEIWAQGGRRCVFVIGGSLGLSPEVVARADEKLSFSQMTFPHGLMRVILLEQLYRGERIAHGERYHK